MNKSMRLLVSPHQSYY